MAEPLKIGEVVVQHGRYKYLLVKHSAATWWVIYMADVPPWRLYNFSTRRLNRIREMSW